AVLWLGQLKKDGLAGIVEHEVLTALADVHYNHKRLNAILAEVMLDLGRMDYSAKRVYKTLLEDPELALEIKTAYQDKIHGLLGEPEEPGGPGKILETNGAGRVISTSPNSIGLKKRLLSLTLSFFSVFFTGAVRVLKNVSKWLSSFLSFCILFIGRVIALLRERERVGFYLRAGAMGLLSVWLLFFMVNTISHILKSRAEEKEPRMIEIQVSKPFTIQVAAYLKQVHADRYAGVLKKKGFTPFIKKVRGGGKTWYVVR
ncbi:MAG: SPOR domain-containing protein, partial [Desulfobacteraceae bacterium]|nr:SPOR domain-containing protein [Desulfobacteraceae bacterium]